MHTHTHFLLQLYNLYICNIKWSLLILYYYDIVHVSVYLCASCMTESGWMFSACINLSYCFYDIEEPLYC